MFSFYRIVLLFKFVGVVLYAGGLVASLVATDYQERRRAVHGIASPALLLVWIAGYLLAEQLHVALTELWILGGLLFSLSSMLVLVSSVARSDRARTRGQIFAAAVPLLLVLVLMVFRPTWSTLLGR